MTHAIDPIHPTEATQPIETTQPTGPNPPADACGCEAYNLPAHEPQTPDVPGYHDTKVGLSRRLKRIEGQVRGIEKMVDDDRYCIDVLTQISAVQSGLKAVALQLLDEHLAHCVVEAARQGGEAQETKLSEVSDALARLVRS